MPANYEGRREAHAKGVKIFQAREIIYLPHVVLDGARQQMLRPEQSGQPRGRTQLLRRRKPSKKLPIPKLQAPKKHQVPNTNHQAPNSREAPSSKRGPRFGAWNLGFLWCLELGFWCFDSGISLELGVWCLVFRSAAAQKLRCDPKTIKVSRDEILTPQLWA